MATIKLLSAHDCVLPVTKTIKNALNIDRQYAKLLVRSIPTTITNLTPEDAIELNEELLELGAKTELFV